MHGSTYVFVGAMIVGCGEKAPPAPAVQPEAAPPVVEEPAPEPEPEPEPEPVEPAVPASNADLTISVTRNDGSTAAGHVWLVQRSTDWYGEEGWTGDPGDAKLQLEGHGTEIMAPWNEIKKMSVTISKVSESSDCTYDSNYSPWMYDCTLRNTGTAVTTDGRNWESTDRHRWRLSFDGGDSQEFWLAKHPARQQDAETVGLDSSGENYDLYIALQDRLREEVKTMVTGVTVQAP